MGFWAKTNFTSKELIFLAKVTWKNVFDEFKQRHPNLAKMVVEYRPHSYGMIVILFEDGKSMVYDYDAKCGRWIDNWKPPN